MNKAILLALSAAASAMFVAAAPAYAQNQDDAAYKGMTDKAKMAYDGAKARCSAEQGNARKVCLGEARVARAQAEEDAVIQYHNSARETRRARTSLANAEYDLAKAKCADMTGSDKRTCQNDAKAAQVAALDRARSGTIAQTGSATSEERTAAATSPSTTMPKENCDQISNAAERTACVSRNMAGTARNAVADTVITTKIKADLVRDPDLKAMEVHVETVKGVVMLSGFVPSQAEANKAEELARKVEGVTEVKNGLKVK